MKTTARLLAILAATALLSACTPNQSRMLIDSAGAAGTPAGDRHLLIEGTRSVLQEGAEDPQESQDINEAVDAADTTLQLLEAFGN